MVRYRSSYAASAQSYPLGRTYVSGPYFDDDVELDTGASRRTAALSMATFEDAADIANRSRRTDVDLMKSINEKLKGMEWESIRPGREVVAKCSRFHKPRPRARTEPPRPRKLKKEEEKPKEFKNKYLNEYQQCFLQPGQYIDALKEKGKFPDIQSRSKEGSLSYKGPITEYKASARISPERSTYEHKYSSLSRGTPERSVYSLQYRAPSSGAYRTGSMSKLTEDVDDDEGYYQIYRPITSRPVYRYYRSSTPEPVRYYRSSTPDPVRYYRSSTPDPVGYYRSSTPEPASFRSSTPEPDRYYRSSTPEPASFSTKYRYMRSLTPEPEMFRYSRTISPDEDEYSHTPVSHQLNRYPDIYTNYYSAGDTYNPESQTTRRSTVSGGSRGGGYGLYRYGLGGISYTGLDRMYTSPITTRNWMN